MDKRICIGFLFSLFAIAVFSQTEAPNDSIKLLVPAVPESLHLYIQTTVVSFCRMLLLTHIMPLLWQQTA